MISSIISSADCIHMLNRLKPYARLSVNNSAGEYCCCESIWY